MVAFGIPEQNSAFSQFDQTTVFNVTHTLQHSDVPACLCTLPHI
jgi:hypothetical protein